MNPLVTQFDLNNALEQISLLSREVGQFRRDAEAREERMFEALRRETLARQKLAEDFQKKLNTRRRIEGAALAAMVTLVVGLSQVFSSHSYAQAQVQVHEMNRLDRTEELAQLKAHDDLVIKRTLDEREKRDILIVKGKP